MKNQNIYLAGYEDVNLKNFVRKLEQNNVSLVIDVRELPLSRKKGFSKNTLAKSLKSRGIEYEHIRALGSPRDIRVALKSGENDYLEFFKAYRLHIKKHKEELRFVLDKVTSQKVCLMCYERDTEACHRALVADELHNLAPQLKAVAI